MIHSSRKTNDFTLQKKRARFSLIEYIGHPITIACTIEILLILYNINIEMLSDPSQVYRCDATALSSTSHWKEVKFQKSKSIPTHSKIMIDRIN